MTYVTFQISLISKKTSFQVKFLFNNYLKKCKDNLETESLKIFITSLTTFNQIRLDCAMLLSLGVQANFDGNLNPKLVCSIPSTNHMMVKIKVFKIVTI